MASETEPEAEHFRALLNAITDYAIFELDSAGNVVTWNAGAERGKGYTAAEIIGQHFSRFFTAHDRAQEKPAQALATARDAGRYEEEGWRVRKDGSRFWASVIIDPIRAKDGRITGFAKITRDISHIKDAQETLRVSEQRFRLLMENVVQYGIFTLNTSGYVTSWNAGAKRIKGYARDEIVGRHYSVFFTPDDLAAHLPDTALATARREGRWQSEGWRVRKDGTRFWASVVLQAMRDDDGALLGFAKITQDITERKALEEVREQLLQAQKMESLGRLTGGVAHDFNNLLCAVMGSLELIGMHASDGEKVRRLADSALQAAERGAMLTAQLLSFSRRQVLRPTTVNMNTLIAAFEPFLQRASGDRLKIRARLATDLDASELDAAHFQSALLNLVFNARDAMPNGGELTIETRNVMLDEQTAHDLGEIQPGAYILLTVQDTGHGMSPDVIEKAIEPFFTTKEVGKGSGLGLSQVYGFVRQSSGQLKIASEVGQGTCVSVYVPKSNRQLPAGMPAEYRHLSIGDGRKILVVEDDPDLLNVAVSAIKSFGYEVQFAADGYAALDMLRFDESIDILFTDVIMPHGMNGVELARQARQIHPSLRVLLTSGYPRDALADTEDFDDDMAFIAKPYSLPTLSELLRGLALGPPN